MKKYYHPICFVGGIILGFAICCVAGFLISQRAGFINFARIFEPIMPITQYYPNPEELLVTIEKNMTPDQILVLIGGNSIFRGDGQNLEELWSLKLQELLGDKFKVLNFATAGAGMTSFGGVIFRILQEKYPKIIFVSTTAHPFQEQMIDGGDLYGYLFWDAYYKGYLKPDPAEKEIINKIRKMQLSTAKGIEKQLFSLLNSVFYYRNLWNWVGYNHFFTVWTDVFAKTPFKPRRDVVESSTDYQLHKKAREKESYFQIELTQMSNIISQSVDWSSTNPELKQIYLSEASRIYDTNFSSRYRSKILCVIMGYNPRHIAALPEKQQQAYDLLLNQSVSVLKDLNFNAISIGKNLTPDDYLDGGHLIAEGGNKLAIEVSEEIQKIAIMNGYS